MGKSRSSVRPLPIEDLRRILSVLRDVLPVIDELVAEKLFSLSMNRLEFRDAMTSACGVPTDILAELMTQTHIQSPRFSL